MAYFPMCVDLAGAQVLLVGSGPQIEEKIEKLRPFGAVLRRLDTLTAEDLEPRPAFVVVGGLEKEERARISALCRGQNIPVNVVDDPALCSFFFPALIVEGDLTVSVSTGGRSPAAAACLRRQIETALPDHTGEILDWLAALRQRRKGERALLRRAAERAFALDRPLTAEELDEIASPPA